MARDFILDANKMLWDTKDICCALSNIFESFAVTRGQKGEEMANVV